MSCKDAIMGFQDEVCLVSGGSAAIKRHTLTLVCSLLHLALSYYKEMCAGN